jgi:LuxR family transcriptional regulator, maltose regulon positive regulatory protein
VAVPTAKVSVPRPIARSVDRARLLDSWCGDPQTPSTADVFVACAPAGYGKTILLASLAERFRSSGMPVAWVTCDREDDTTTFWAATLLAVSRAGGDSPALASLVPPRDLAEASFVATFLNVVESELPELLLVLDDVHQLQDPAVLDGLRVLLERAPAGMRVALGERFDPPLPLHRLRLAGRVRELRAADLAFTPEEAHEFWARHDTSLDQVLEERVLALTEGWPAGLRMVALSLERVEDPQGFVEDFDGDDRSVADYLSGEVLARMPEDVVDFLLRTCVAEELNDDLAAELSGRPDAGALLDDLEQQNALVVRLSGPGRWFRYHALLRSYLGAVSRRRRPGQVETLHAVAASWFLERDRPREALEHALAGGDDELVESILRRRGLHLLLTGSPAALRQVTKNPPPGLAGSPVVLVHRALTALEDGDLAGAEETLAELDRRADDPDERVRALRRLAVLHKARLESDLAGARASELVDGIGLDGDRPDVTYPSGDVDPDIRLLILADRGVLRLVAGDYDGAHKDLARAFDLARSAGLDYLALYCLNQLTGAYVAENDFRAGRHAAEAAIAFAAERGWAGSPRMAYSYALAGWTAFLLLEADAAARWAAEGTALLQTLIDVEVVGVVRSAEAVISFDDPTQRAAALDRLEQITVWMSERSSSPGLTAHAAYHELRICLTLGEWAKAERAVARAKQRLGTLGDVAVLEANLAFARGRTVEARRLLQPVISGELVPAITTGGTTARLLEAMIAARNDRRAAAVEAVLDGLAHAAPTGAIRPFFDAGLELRPLLSDLHGRAGRLEPFLATVLEGIDRMDAWQSACGTSSSSATAATSAVPAGLDGEWLTERELDVLRELPSMMTLSEIASAQGVSPNTIKTHVRSIYLKLHSGSRREAIAVARRRGLL